MTKYITVFEINKPVGESFFFMVLFVIFCFIFIYFTLVFCRYKRKRNYVIILKDRFLIVVFFIAAIVGIIFLVYLWIEGNELLTAYRNGDFEIIEGQVEVLHEQPKEGHDRGDIIRINEKEIEINYFRTGPQYKSTLAHGGILSEGAEVRLCLYKNKILRIDIIKKQND